jgi:hypothetical protein
LLITAAIIASRTLVQSDFKTFPDYDSAIANTIATVLVLSAHMQTEVGK